MDLLCTDCQVTYNAELAQVIGLHSAIYLTELINISRKASQKNKLIDGKYFVIDRGYIKKRTTFDKDEQVALEKQLTSLNIAEPGQTKDSLFVNLETLSGLMLGNEDVQEAVKKVAESTAKKNTKMTQKQRCASEMKHYIYSTNSELVDAYSEWIDAAVDKLGWLSKKAVTVAQQTVDSYCKGDLDLALKIIEIGAVNGYRDMTWAISAFEERFKDQFYKSKKEQAAPVQRTRANLSSEIF